jgi:hypothetical protein
LLLTLVLPRVLLLLLLLQIPTNRVKLLVGPGGATIKDIQRKSK